MNEMRVRQEIIASGRHDFGIPENSAKYAFYNDKINKLKSGEIDIETARNEIGKRYVQGTITSNTHEPYEKYHGDWYINTYLSSLENSPQSCRNKTTKEEN